MSLTLLGIISISLTIILIGIGIAISLFGMAKGGKRSTDEPQVYGGGRRDPLQDFGLVYRTTNIIRASVGWDENEGDIIDILVNVQGKKYDVEKDELVSLAPGEDPFADETPLDWFARTYLSRWVYGLPFIHKIRPIKVDRVVEKASDPSRNRKLAEDLEASTVIRYGLYGVFPRPMHLADMDSRDNTRFSVNILATIEVVKPRLVFSRYANNFMPMIDAQLRAFMKDRISSKKYDEYVDDDTEFTEDKLDGLNRLLITVGFKCTLLTESDPELHPEVQTAKEQKFRAVEAAAAGIIAAEGLRDSKMRIADGDLYAAQKKAEGIAYELTRLAQAYGDQVNQIYTSYKGKGFNDEDALRMTHEQITLRISAEAIGKNTGVWAPGNGAGIQLSVPTTREKIVEPTSRS